MKIAESITQKELKKQLFYNLKSGIFVWKIAKSGIKKGIKAGYIQNGYISIEINGKAYLAHRLAWLYVHGYLPENDIDHIDRVRHHNWISNLREASRQCNVRNTGNRKNNTSGVKGVSWQNTVKKWKSEICVNKKLIYLGIYSDFDEAVCYRLAAEQCLDWDGCDSNSPAYKYIKENII